MKTYKLTRMMKGLDAPGDVEVKERDFLPASLTSGKQ